MARYNSRSMVLAASFVTVLLAIGSLAWGFAAGGFDSLARWSLYLGAVWLIAQARRWWWVSAAGLIVTVLMSSLGLILSIPAGWMFAAGVFALVAWDLSEFRRRYRFVVPSESRDPARRHLARASSLAALGLVLSTLLMLWRSDFTLEWAVFLAVTAVLGLSQLLAWVKKK